MKHLNNNTMDDISFDKWLRMQPSSEELGEAFLNMDIAMKYVHEHGYCVKSFNPKDITLLDNSVDEVKFNYLLKIPDDNKVKRKVIQEDIYNSSLVQIGVYTNCLNYLNSAFVKENFDRFAELLPQDNVPYYKGVIVDNASVYLCEYTDAKRKKDLENLEKEFGDQGNEISGGRQIVKSNGHSLSDSSDNINDLIYRQINHKSDAAFVSFLIYPTIILILGVLMAMVAYVFSFF